MPTNIPIKRKRSTRKKYTPEFRAEAVKLVLEGGLSRAQAARDLGVGESVLGRWVARAEEFARPEALSETEHRELKRLRQENRILRKEREILKNAAAFFAKEILCSLIEACKQLRLLELGKQ